MQIRTSIIAALALLALGSAAVLPDAATAQDRLIRRQLRPQPQTPVQPRFQATPTLAVVGLREQQVVIYDQTGAKMLESPVSSGTTGYETPPGIFSVVQKNVEHHSNLYDDASMPFMQRITWTGIALHAGALPGYPASHGCVRLPHDFAERLFGLTNLGMRVVVVRDAMAPSPIPAPAIFKAKGSGHTASVKPGEGSAHVGHVDETASITRASTSAGSVRGGNSLQAIAYDKMRAAELAADKAKEARAVSARAAAAAAPAVRLVKLAEANVARAEADLKAADRILDANPKPQKAAQAEASKAKAQERIEKAKADLEKTVQQSLAKTEAAKRAASEADVALAAAAIAAEEADQAKQNTAPVSVFISRKTQRIYVRKAFHPVYEGPVIIKDVDKPLGSFVFTALTGEDGAAEDLRWNVVSMYRDPINIEPYKAVAKVKGAPKSEPAATDPSYATAALNRITVPRETAERISEIVLPGSSLIISDEAPSIETGKDTDFVVIMSGEPQGGIAIRARPERSNRYDDDDYGSRRRRGGGGGGFWFWD